MTDAGSPSVNSNANPSRTLSRFGMLVAATLFVGWLCWLAFLATTKTKQIVVSRSQLMQARLVVVATVQAQEGRAVPEITVTKTIYSAEGDVGGRKLRVVDLNNGRIPYQTELSSGEYVIFLTTKRTADSTEYLLASSPQDMPGFRVGQSPRPWIYPNTDDIHRQIRSLLKIE
jgi:hypothetical protein